MTNRLADATSPYLLQHRDNPVHWQEWGETAFAEARARNVPVLLSVGYAACHWCHVMAHESFEDEAVARALNDRFVAVKVDREERPDIDAVYMSAVTATTGHGGWPMTVFLTPEGEPFFCGTYFPRDHFLRVLEALDEAWRTRESEVRESGTHIATTLAGALQSPSPYAVQPADLERAVAQLASPVRPARRRVRWRTEVPTVDGPRVPAAPPRAHRGRASPGDGEPDARGDGTQRDVRPGRWRVRPVRRGRRVGRAALREDALRQRAAAAGLRPLVACDGGTAGAQGGRGDGGLPPHRPAHGGRGVRVLARRGHRRGGGADLRLDPRPAAGRPRGRGRRSGGGHLPRDRHRQLRARHVDDAAGRRTRTSTGSPGCVPRLREARDLRSATRARRQGRHLVERAGRGRPRRGGRAARPPGVGGGRGRAAPSSSSTPTSSTTG